MTIPQTTRTSAGLGNFGLRQALIPALALITVIAFGRTLTVLPGIWSEDRSHGFLAAAVGLWLIWRDRKQLTVSGESWGFALPMLVALSLLWLIGVIISAEVVQIAVLPLFFVGWLLAVYGTGSLTAAWPIAAVFFLCVPMWEVLVWPLQMMTVLFNAMLLKITGLEAVIRGESITLPSGTLVVAGSCSGINFLMAALTISASYAMLFVRQLATRWRIVAFAAFMALLANWIRVFGLVVIAHATEMRSPLIKDHSTYGWVIFAAAMLTFFAMASRFERREREQASATALQLHEDSSRDRGGNPPRNAVLLATLAMVVGPVLLLVVGAIPPAPRIAASPTGIAAVSAWQRPTSGTNMWFPTFAGATDSLVARVVHNGASVQANRLLFGHRPQEADLTGGGNRIAPDSLTVAGRTIGPLDASSRIVREAAVKDGGDIRLVWYWYTVANVNTSSSLKAKLLGLVAFFTRAAGPELVTVSTTCAKGNCDSATSALFAVVTGRELPPTSQR